MVRQPSRSSSVALFVALATLVVACSLPCATALPSTAHKLRMALSARDSAHGRALARGQGQDQGERQMQRQMQRQVQRLGVWVAIKGDVTKTVMDCDLELDDGSATTSLDAALKSVQTCDALHQRLGNAIGACALRDLDSTWVDSIAHADAQKKKPIGVTDYTTNKAVPKTELQSDPNAVKLVVWLKAELLTAHVLRAQMGTAVSKKNAPDLSPPTPVACGVFPFAKPQFSDAVLTRCGECLHPTVAQLQGKQAHEAVPFAKWFVADVYSVNGKTSLPKQDADLTGVVDVVFEAPVKFTVHYDDSGKAQQTTAEVWIKQRFVSTNKFDVTLLQRLNERAATAQPPHWQKLVATGATAYDATNSPGTHESVLTLAAGGAPVPWGGEVPYWLKGGVVMELMQPLTVANFPAVDLNADNGKGAFVDQPRSTSQVFDTADSTHTGHTTGSNEVIFLNFASGKFAPDATSPTKPRADFADAVFKASGKTYRDEVTPKALFDLLVKDGGGSASASRELKRDIEKAHGAGNKHFGFAYFLLRVSYGKSIKPGKHSSWRYVGFLSAADNIKKGDGGLSGPNGAGRHTEQRIMEQLRRFIVALENTAHNGVKLLVTEVESRWVTDYFPDVSKHNNCDYALRYYTRCAKQSTFRDCHYTEAVREAFEKSNYNAALERLKKLNSNKFYQENEIIQRIWAELTDATVNTKLGLKALEWHTPVDARVYHNGCSIATDEGTEKEQIATNQLQNKCRDAASNNGKRVPSKAEEEQYAPKSKGGLPWAEQSWEKHSDVPDDE